MRLLMLTLIIASAISFIGAFTADREGRKACEARHSPATCTHLLRG